MSHGPTFHRPGEQTERQPEPENNKMYKAKRMQDARESQSDDAPWERVLRAIINIKSDLGGLRKSVNEHGVKIKALAQADDAANQPWSHCADFCICLHVPC